MMATSGCFGVRIDGRDKLTYNHHDSYPRVLGENVANAVRLALDEHGRDALLANARALRLVSSKIPPTDNEVRRFRCHANLNVGYQSTEDWYCLLYNLQGDLFATLDDGVMVDAGDFIADSLFCEFAYVANLDDWTFEAYRGDQRTKHSFGRYADAPTCGDGYFPCALVATFPLDDIPEDWARHAFPDKYEDSNV